jgi:DMSO reductase anchor subunit
VQVRDERHADILLGFVHLACALSCHKSLNRVPVSRCSREIAD